MTKKPKIKVRKGRVQPTASSKRKKATSTPARESARQDTSLNFESKTIGLLRLERLKAQQESNAQQVVAKEKRKSALPFIVVGSVLFLAASFLCIYLVLINTNVFEIKDIQFSGTDHLTAKEVSALVTISQGTTLLNVDEKRIINSLKRDAWVKDVSITKVYPDKLSIYVEERAIGAIVEVPTGVADNYQDWAIADDRMWLMPIPNRDSEVGKGLSEAIYTDAAAALHIIGVPYGVSPKIGSYCRDSNINNALDIISHLTTELADRLKVVTATDAESTLLTLDNNIEIAFGSATDIREKELICLEIMKQNPKVVYINVRTPDKPTWRSA